MQPPEQLEPRQVMAGDSYGSYPTYESYDSCDVSAAYSSYDPGMYGYGLASSIGSIDADGSGSGASSWDSWASSGMDMYSSTSSSDDAGVGYSSWPDAYSGWSSGYDSSFSSGWSSDCDMYGSSNASSGYEMCDTYASASSAPGDGLAPGMEGMNGWFYEASNGSGSSSSSELSYSTGDSWASSGMDMYSSPWSSDGTGVGYSSSPDAYSGWSSGYDSSFSSGSSSGCEMYGSSIASTGYEMCGMYGSGTYADASCSSSDFSASSSSSGWESGMQYDAGSSSFSPSIGADGVRGASDEIGSLRVAVAPSTPTELFVIWANAAYEPAAASPPAASKGGSAGGAVEFSAEPMFAPQLFQVPMSPSADAASTVYPPAVAGADPVGAADASAPTAVVRLADTWTIVGSDAPSRAVASPDGGASPCTGKTSDIWPPSSVESEPLLPAITPGRDQSGVPPMNHEADPTALPEPQPSFPVNNELGTWLGGCDAINATSIDAIAIAGTTIVNVAAGTAHGDTSSGAGEAATCSLVADGSSSPTAGATYTMIAEACGGALAEAAANGGSAAGGSRSSRVQMGEERSASSADASAEAGQAPLGGGGTVSNGQEQAGQPDLNAQDDATQNDEEYDWEADEFNRSTQDAWLRFIDDVQNYAASLNVESEGRFEQGIVYTEEQLIGRLEAHMRLSEDAAAIDDSAGDDAPPQEASRTGQENPLDTIPPTVIPATKPEPFGPVSGWLQRKAEEAGAGGGVLGGMGHAAYGTSAAVVSLFDRVTPAVACAAAGIGCDVANGISTGLTDVVGGVFIGQDIFRRQNPNARRCAEAVAFADYVYDEKFSRSGSDRGGLLRVLGIAVPDTDGLDAALFRGESGTFYLAVRGTESLPDWRTNVTSTFGVSDAYDAFNKLADEVNERLEQLGGSLVICGHSLGGGMAISGANFTGAEAEVFNPSYPSSSYARVAPAQIRINVVQGDPLEFMRNVLHRPAQGQMFYWRPKVGQGFAHGLGHFTGHK